MSRAEQPFFSVVIPLYNKAAFIAETVASVLSQTYDNFELLVVDDGSTDGGAEQLRGIMDDRMRVIPQMNAGEGAARNRGLAEMRGEVAAFLDADDAWGPTHLADIAELAERFPTAGLFGTRFARLEANDLREDTSISCTSPILITDYFSTATQRGFYINSSSSAIRREVFEKLGGFMINTPVGADQEYWARVSLLYANAYHPRSSAVYRTGLANSAMHLAKWQERYPALVETLKTALADGIVPAGKEAAVSEYAAWILLNHAAAGLAAARSSAVRRILEDRIFDNCSFQRRYWCVRLLAQVPGGAARALLNWHARNHGVAARMYRALTSPRTNVALGKSRVP